MANGYSLGNVFGATSEEVLKGGKNIWHKVNGVYPVGGVISSADCTAKAGGVITAGTPVQFDETDGTITVAGTTAENVRGLLYHDVAIPADYAKMTNAACTGAVVYDGVIYQDRVEGLTDEILKALPNIIGFKEA